jgi:hypothetical protein
MNLPTAGIFLLFLFHSLYFASAQVPGYMGKKNVVHADVWFMPANPLAYDQPRNYSGNTGFYFNAHQGGGYERVVSRRHLVGADFDLFRFGNPEAQLDGDVGRSRARGTGFGLHFKAFPFIRKGWLAPLGPYFGMEYKLIWVRSEFIAETGSQLPRLYARHRGGSLGMNIGYSMLIVKKLLLDYGIRFALTDLRGRLTADARAQEDAFILQNQDLMKLHLGLGFLF